MWPHGESKYWIKNNILITSPTGGFNQQGIHRHCTEILNHVEAITGDWLLIELTDDSTGITLDSIETLISGYQQFIEQGCALVICKVNNTWREAITKALPKTLTPYIHFVTNIDDVQQTLKLHSDIDILQFLNR